MIQTILSWELTWLFATIAIYTLALGLYQRTRAAYLHPVLLTFVAVIVMLRYSGVSYTKYREATEVLDLMLGMSVVSLGYLMYEQLHNIKRYILPLLVSTVVASVVGILSVVYIAMAFGADRVILTSIAPKSVTVPIAVAVSEPLGGVVAITSVVVFCVGLFGSLFGPWLLRRFGVSNSVAQGFALGAASHGIGTARAIELGALQGAISGLAMALMGIATAVMMPIIEKYLY